jgi:hypothetical protein
VTAFLASGIAGALPEVVGEPYRDASGNEYLPRFVQPVLVYARAERKPVDKLVDRLRFYP